MSGTAKDNVVVKNIYYMMAYAYRSIDAAGTARLESEDFDNFADLLAAILALGISLQRKRGFEREYSAIGETLAGIKGRLDVGRTSRLLMSGHQKTYCHVDVYSEETYKNRVLKRCAEIMSVHPDVSKARKADLKRCLIFMRDVSAIDEKRIDWGRLKYDRNNRTYQMLMNVCWMTLNEQIPSDAGGARVLSKFMSNRELDSLYEKFILQYFKREHPYLHASASMVKGGRGDSLPSFIPNMYSDIILRYGASTLVIDAKCYGQILQNHYEREILSPDNCNQIFSYVIHEGFGRHPSETRGMLLYALTSSDDAIDESWTDCEHTFYCRTLDLNCDFKTIAEQLDDIAKLLCEEAG